MLLYFSLALLGIFYVNMSKDYGFLFLLIAFSEFELCITNLWIHNEYILR